MAPRPNPHDCSYANLRARARELALFLGLGLVLAVFGFTHEARASQQNSPTSLFLPKDLLTPSEPVRVSEPELPGQPTGPSRFSRRTLHPLCAQARISELEFSDVEGYRPYTNYCLSSDSAIPTDLRQVLVQIGQIHDRISTFLEIPLEQLLVRNFKIEIVSGRHAAVGARASEGGASGLMLTTYPNWTARDFSSDVYIHELFHLLVGQGGRLGQALRGLEEHPFLVETLPDVLVTEMKKQPKIVTDETRLPACLAELRDGTPVQSFDRSYRDFYPFRDLERGLSCCEKLLPSERTVEAEVFCRTQSDQYRIRKDAAEKFAENYDLKRSPYTSQALDAPFRAENCRVKTRAGQTWITNCDTHEFAPVLISFFQTLRETTGRSHLSSWLKHLETRRNTVDLWNCSYRRGTRTLGGTQVEIARRPLLAEWVSYRDILPESEQRAFDRAWEFHALARMAELDEMFLNDTVESAAQLLLKEKNPLFADQNSCGNLYDFDLNSCGVRCEKSP